MFGTTQNTRNTAPQARPLKALKRCKTGLNRSKSIARLYARDEEGSLLIFGIFTFVIVLVLAGISVDIVRHETLRTELQNTLDRAVLAAANRETTSDARAVVEDYFAKASLTPYLEDVEVTGVGIGKRVTATVSADIPTYFLRFSGIDNLELFSSGTAEQGMAELEVALVLDVSGSMNSSNRLPNLSVAGQQFAQTVFANSADGHVAVSVVPYATQVNAGADIASQFLRSDSHETSHCLNFDAADFLSNSVDLATTPNAKTYEQTMNFDPFYYNEPNDGLILETCNPAANNRIMPFATTLSAVTNKITGLTAQGNTSIDVGVKWGTTLLDPSFQPATSALILDEVWGAEQAGRPHDYSSATLKVMVVMTDGVNTSQYYMPDAYRTGLSDIYLDTSTDRVSFQTSCGWGSGCSWSNNFYAPHNDSFYSTPVGGWSGSRRLTWPEVWDRFTIESHAYTRYEASGNSNDYYNWRNWTRQSVGSNTKNARLLDACQAAKDKGILVFTIGFEAPDSGASVLRDCASSASHYFDANGLEIAEAFSAVATKITELRLVE
jgi:Flp pilus assembly protein TadG